jgi:hypothetical protein
VPRAGHKGHFKPQKRIVFKKKNFSYLFSDSGKYDKECKVERSKHDAECDSGGVPDDCSAVACSVERGAAILAKEVKPAAHPGAVAKGADGSDDEEGGGAAERF